MRIIMLALFARGARALSAVPAAARRLQKIKELESKHALLVESGAKPAVIRNARKELGRLKRTPPPRGAAWHLGSVGGWWQRPPFFKFRGRRVSFRGAPRARSGGEERAGRAAAAV